jgi:alpha-L-fucosidase
MLGNNGELNWEITPGGMKIKIPGKKPCEHAYSFKITFESIRDLL